MGVIKGTTLNSESNYVRCPLYNEGRNLSFQAATTWAERLEQIRTLKNRCNDLVGRLDVGVEDVRAEAIIQVRQFCNTLAAVPIKLQQNAEANPPAIMEILGLTRFEDLKSCLGDLNKNTKLSFITMTQFALENCVERVLDALPGEQSQGYFSKAAERIIEIAELANRPRKLEVLMVPAWIRNSLHAGGVHTRATKSVTIDGASYVFEKGRRVSCATWSHLVHCVQHALGVYEEVLCAPVIAAVPKIVAT